MVKFMGIAILSLTAVGCSKKKVQSEVPAKVCSTEGRAPLYSAYENSEGHILLEAGKEVRFEPDFGDWQFETLDITVRNSETIDPLPAGLVLDSKTGVISGKISEDLTKKFITALSVKLEDCLSTAPFLYFVSNSVDDAVSSEDQQDPTVTPDTENAENAENPENPENPSEDSL